MPAGRPPLQIPLTLSSPTITSQSHKPMLERAWKLTSLPSKTRRLPGTESGKVAGEVRRVFFEQVGNRSPVEGDGQNARRPRLPLQFLRIGYCPASEPKRLLIGIDSGSVLRRQKEIVGSPRRIPCGFEEKSELGGHGPALFAVVTQKSLCHGRA